MSRILMCALGAEPGPVGGAERQAWRQSVELVRRRHVVTLVCPWTPGTRSARREGVRILRLPQLPVRYLRTLTYVPFLLAYVLTRGRTFDLVHVHLANPQAEAVAIGARIVKRPFYVKLAAGGPRGEVQRLRRLSPITRRIGIRWASRVQAISSEIAADLAAIGLPAERVVRIPNGLDTDAIRPPLPEERLALREALGLPRDATIALFLGRFAGYKGIADLLTAWRSVTGDAVLVLVGEPALDDPVAVPESAHRLVVRPWSASVADYLRAADMLLQPSHAEGMSNTILEAMSAGLPIVATDVGAAREMLEEGAGIVVPARDPDALASAVQGLIDAPGRRAALGSRAREVAVRRYGIEAVVDRIEGVYGQILTERTG